MSKPSLPVQALSSKDFNSDFKETHLDGQVLKDADLKAIEQLFGLDDRSANSKVGGVNCCEYHAHSYRCNIYYSPEAGIVDRLILEIRNYQSRFSKIDEIAKISK